MLIPRSVTIIDFKPKFSDVNKSYKTVLLDLINRVDVKTRLIILPNICVCVVFKAERKEENKRRCGFISKRVVEQRLGHNQMTSYLTSPRRVT